MVRTTPPKSWPVVGSSPWHRWCIRPSRAPSHGPDRTSCNLAFHVRAGTLLRRTRCNESGLPMAGETQGGKGPCTRGLSAQVFLQTFPRYRVPGKNCREHTRFPGGTRYIPWKKPNWSHWRNVRRSRGSRLECHVDNNGQTGRSSEQWLLVDTSFQRGTASSNLVPIAHSDRSRQQHRRDTRTGSPNPRQLQVENSR